MIQRDLDANVTAMNKAKREFFDRLSKEGGFDADGAARVNVFDEKITHLRSELEAAKRAL